VLPVEVLAKALKRRSSARRPLAHRSKDLPCDCRFAPTLLARWRVVEAWLTNVLATKNVWFAPLEQIVAHVDALVQSGRYEIRTEELPYFTRPVAP